MACDRLEGLELGPCNGGVLAEAEHRQESQPAVLRLERNRYRRAQGVPALVGGEIVVGNTDGPDPAAVRGAARDTRRA